MHPFITIGNITFESYTLMINLGMLIGLFSTWWLLERYCEKERFCWKLLLFLIGILLVGIPFSHFLKNLFGGSEDGTHFLGRVLLICVFTPAFLQLFWKEESGRLQAANAVAMYFVIQHFFDRIGCWMNGCCGGIYIDWLNMKFPSQLFEAFMMAALGAALAVRIRKGRAFFFQTGMGFAAVIFVSEFLIDQPELGRVLGLTSVQFGAMILLVWGIAGLLRIRKI
ncbi:MAG: prolipoprotein diacylglyceryl transferase [Lachnospiraceae bacterium]|nr:prolipoprotein diacylglyceryl transferase [Lachnospiraceae bacterium]